MSVPTPFEQKMSLSLDEIIKEKSKDAKAKRAARKSSVKKTPTNDNGTTKKKTPRSASSTVKAKAKAKLNTVQRNAKLAEKRQMSTKAIAAAQKRANNPAKVNAKILSSQST